MAVCLGVKVDSGDVKKHISCRHNHGKIDGI